MTYNKLSEARQKYYDEIQKEYPDGETIYSDQYLDSLFGGDYKKRQQAAI
jgi:hypothetical protein